jgi:uncharacterized membrane protein YphA (DoxX/SURF4 family)
MEKYISAILFFFGAIFIAKGMLAIRNKRFGPEEGWSKFGEPAKGGYALFVAIILLILGAIFILVALLTY